MSYPYNTPFNKKLTTAQMEENAKYLAQLMTNRGWSLNAICAALGNWQSECGLNPNDPEYSGYPTNTGGGFGLPQWTPWYRKYGVWCKNNGIANIASNDNPAADFTNQLNYHDYECVNGYITASGEHSPTWLNRGGYSYTWSAFKAATDDVAEMAKAYYWQYERSGAQSVGKRGEQAIKWFNFLQGVSPDPNPDPPTPSGGDFIALQVDTINVTKSANLLNLVTEGTDPLEIYATLNKSGEIELEFDVTKLYAQVWEKVAGSESTYYVIDGVEYNSLPNPSAVVTSADDTTNNLVITNIGNKFTIKGKVYKPLNPSKYVPVLKTPTKQIGILYKGSLQYGGQTLNTSDIYTYINLYINLLRKRKPWMMALKQRRYY